MKEIKFGTDGWRGLIAKDFTFLNVTRLTIAVAKTMQESLPNRNCMIVGHDRRFLSRDFAKTVSTTFVNQGYKVLLSASYAPTPALSWHAKHQRDVAGAVVITASHNPPSWNGFKFKEIFGGSALPKTTEAFEKTVGSISLEEEDIPSELDYDRAIKEGKIKLFDPMHKYVDAMKKHVDLDLIKKNSPKTAIDVMYGSASTYFKTLLEELGLNVLELHGDDNPGFQGVAPEPIGKNLTELCDAVQKGGYSCGLATDGDADRLGAIDEFGMPFTTQQILSVVYWHLLKNRKKKWSISRSVSTTKMVDLIARTFGMQCLETPVGFKFIAEQMIEGKAQIGGEESGGIGIMEHIPERDGMLTGLLLLEVMAAFNMGLRGVYRKLCEEERPYEFIRLDLHITKSQMVNALERLKLDPPREWLGRKVEEVNTLDGFKFYMEDGSWLLIRPSGTEPIFRLYAETESEENSQEMVEAAKQFVVSS